MRRGAMSAMELWSPLRAHAEWIALLRESLYGDGPLTLPLAADARLCELGRWLAVREPLYGHLAEYQVAKEVHQAFHRSAAHCLALANSGRRAEAITEAGEYGELRRKSRQLVGTLQSLKRRIIEIEGERAAWSGEAAPR